MSFISTTHGSKVSKTRCDNFASEVVAEDVEVDRYIGVVDDAMGDFRGLDEVSGWKPETVVFRDESKRATSFVKEAEVYRDGWESLRIAIALLCLCVEVVALPLAQNLTTRMANGDGFSD